MKKILVINSLLLAFSLVLTACTAATPTQDPNQIATQVAALVDAQVATKMAQALAATQAQQQALPTNTPMIPTIGPIPTLATVNIPTLSLPGMATGNPCLATPRNEGENYPDGTTLYTNFAFTKRWTISNQGSCTWNANYKLKFVSGDQMGGPAFILFGASVPPWQTLALELPLKTADSVGTSTGYWGLYDDKDVYFGRVWVSINRITVAPTSSVYAVTDVTITQSGTGSCTYNAAITTNGGGGVEFHWIIDVMPIAPNISTSLFTGAQTHTFTYSTTLTGTHTVHVYIDTPNRVEFGPTAFTCPP